MFVDPAIHVEVVFSDVALHALDPAVDAGSLPLPAGFLSRAHQLVPGDLLQLQGCLGVFVVTQRLWALQAGRSTLRLTLDVLVQDEA